MPDGDEDLKKDFKLELSKFNAKVKPTLAEALSLRMDKAELLKEKEPDKAELKKIDLSLKKLNDKYLTEAASLEDRINQSLKDYKEEPKDPRGLADWYKKMVEKESGIDLGKDVKLWGDVNFGKKEFKLELKGKF